MSLHQKETLSNVPIHRKAKNKRMFQLSTVWTIGKTVQQHNKTTFAECYQDGHPKNESDGTNHMWAHWCVPRCSHLLFLPSGFRR